jgi:GrpB-like predicted nucleotidyltransferase (UPF0157 family)
MTRKVEVVQYDPAWVDIFQAEAEVLAIIFGEKLVAIHHIGSTAIPGIVAKPIVDILVEVRDIQEVDDLNTDIEKLGYQPRGEYGIPGRRYFVKQTGEVHIHHIHTFQSGNPQVERHLNFRDYLIAHPLDALAYSRLKEDLAQQFPEDIDNYAMGKNDFINNIDDKAFEWKRSFS